MEVCEGEGMCRICLETSPLFPTPISKFSDSMLFDDDSLISPCACTGTQAFVHFKCLRKWQSIIMSTRRPGATYTPALICSVCTQKFSIAPPRRAFIERISKIFTAYSCEIAGLFIVLSACYLALAGHNLQTFLEELESGIALAREVIPCSFQLNALEGKCTSKACSLLGTRLGAGRPQLQPGTLLVATPGMHSPVFFGSVVLLYEHLRCSGSRGLILNMQFEEEKILEWEDEVFPSLKGTSNVKHLAHSLGGPIAQDDWIILNRCSCCVTAPMRHPLCSQQHNIENKPYSKDWGQELLPGVFLGRDAAPIQRHANDEPQILTHQVLHGHAEWFVGQLASEVKRGLWITKQNASEILLTTPPHELWNVLLKE